MEHDLKPAIDLLNRHVPEWYNKIDVELLNITSMQRCILGQLFGNYCNVPPHIRKEVSPINKLFGGTEFFSNAPHPLTEQWKGVIMELQGE